MQVADLIDEHGRPIPYWEPIPGVYIPLDYRIIEPDALLIAQRLVRMERSQ